jgi:surface antigen Omp85-like protein
MPLLMPATVAAQDSIVVIDPNAPASDSSASGLPAEVLQELIQVYNDSLTLRLPNGLTLPAGARLGGTIVAYRGITRIAGEVDGRLTVINGDLVILRGGVVRGDVLVAGGRLSIEDGGLHEGEARIYWDAAPVVRQGDGTLAVRERRRPIGELATAAKTFQWGNLGGSLVLTTGQTYNRIEGLPIVFGAVLDWRASSDLTARLDARGILRTAGNASPFRRDLGWLIRTDWRFSAPRGFGLAARVYSVITGIEEQSLPRDEIGWNAFLFQRDQRDYYNSEGVAGTLYAYPTRRLRLEGGLRYQREGSVRANDPWSLFRNESRWRPNPLIDDGHYTIASLGFEYDARNSRDDPTSGWWLRSTVEGSESNDVAPVTLSTAVRPALPTQGYGFTRMTLDFRRYNRLSPDIRLNLRLWAAGWLSGDPLPVQRRLSLGGVDLLPGYQFRALSCTPPGTTDPARTALCDRAFLFETEFRHRLGLHLGTTLRDRQHQEYTRFVGIQDADLVLFGNSGTAWLAGTGPGRVQSDRIPSIGEWKADVGAGLDAGWLGVYVAKAVTDGEALRVFLRLTRRF